MDIILKTLPFLSDLLDALPSFVFVFDPEVRIVYCNQAGAEFAGENPKYILQKLCGEALGCANPIAQNLECGQTSFCGDCVLRNCIEKAFHGEKSLHVKTGLRVCRRGVIDPVELRVSAFPLNHDDRSYVLAVIDNVTEMNELRAIVPICAWCKKIRDDEHYWHRVDDYLKNHMDIQITHGICPECSEKMKMQ